MNFLTTHWRVVVVAIAGLIIGALLNYWVNKISNKELLDALTAQLNQMKNKPAGARTANDQTKEAQLQAQINLLKIKAV